MESHQRLGFQRNARHESRLSPTKDSINKITWKSIFCQTRGKVTLEIEGISGNSFFSCANIHIMHRILGNLRMNSFPKIENILNLSNKI